MDYGNALKRESISAPKEIMQPASNDKESIFIYIE